MKILLKGIDESVAVMSLASDDVDVEETVRKFRETHPKGFYPEYYVMKEPFSMPSNRYFRDAWIIDRNKNISVDHEKAKSIHMDRIRKQRNKRLEELDAEMLRNISNSDQLQQLEKQKQKLRDVPQNYNINILDVNKPGKNWPKDLINPYK